MKSQHCTKKYDEEKESYQVSVESAQDCVRGCMMLSSMRLHREICWATKSTGISPTRSVSSRVIGRLRGQTRKKVCDMFVKMT